METEANTIESAPSGSDEIDWSDAYKGTIFEGMTPDEVVPDVIEQPEETEADESDNPEVPEGHGDDQGTEEVEQTEEAPQTFIVKVRGEELEVPLDELVSGYSRQADYTRGKQELAQLRAELTPFIELTSMLDKNPEAVVRKLAADYGVQLTSSEQDPDDWFTEPAEGQTEAEKRLAALERRQAQEDARREGERQIAQTNLLWSQLGELHEQHGDFDDMELVTYARDHGHPDLVSAYRNLHWDDRPAAKPTTAKPKVDPKAKADADELVVQAKRAAQVVNGGSAKATGSVKEPEVDLSKLDFRQIAKLSIQQVNNGK